MAKLAQSSFALDLLRRLLCAHTPGNAAGGGSTSTVHADAAALRRGDGAAASKEDEGATARSPCIVARLMGLDAMPTPPRDQQQTLRRSRSASSAEGWSSPTPCCFGDAPRRRVVRTTSASFRDRPTYLRRENDEFLLLSFSPDDDGGDDRDAAGWPGSDDDDAELAGGRRGKGRVDGDGAKKQRRGRRRLPRRRRGEEEAESEHGRSRRPAAAAEECGLENSSPVSVLEARDGQEESSTTTTTSSSSVEELEPCSPSSDGGETRPAPRRQQQQRSRRKLLQANSDNLGGDPRPAAASSSSSCVSKCSDRGRRDRRVMNKAEAIAPDATGTWRVICKMVEQDICGMQWQAMDNGNIAAGMASEIFDQLIWEQTAELVQLTVV